MDLTNEQWSEVRSVLPPPHHGRGRPPVDSRLLLNGILWKIRAGSSWRDIPEKYPSHQTCHRFFLAWKSSGLLEKIMQELYADLIFRGKFTPYQAVADSLIVLHIHERAFDFYLSPLYLNDWRLNTSLLLLQYELHRTLRIISLLVSAGRINKRNFKTLTLHFSKWPKLAPLTSGGGALQTYAGPEDVIFDLKTRNLSHFPIRANPPSRTASRTWNAWDPEFFENP